MLPLIALCLSLLFILEHPSPVDFQQKESETTGANGVYFLTDALKKLWPL